MSQCMQSIKEDMQRTWRASDQTQGRKGTLCGYCRNTSGQQGKCWWNYLPDQKPLEVSQHGCISDLRSRMTSFDLLLRAPSGPKGSAHTHHCCQCQPWGRADSWAQGWAITLGWWQSQDTVLWGFYVVHYDNSKAVVYGMSWHGPFLCWCVSVGKITSGALEVLGLG